MSVKKPPSSADDDADLWRSVVRTVQPYGKPPAPAEKSRKPPATAPAPPGPKAPPARPGTQQGLDAATQRKLKKGKIPIEGRIDLHGMGRDEAFAALCGFIRKASGAGMRTVLVITGKGRGGEGVLRRMVPQWLAEGEMRDLVVGTSTASSADGGEGALYVRLRRKRS